MRFDVFVIFATENFSLASMTMTSLSSSKLIVCRFERPKLKMKNEKKQMHWIVSLNKRTERLRCRSECQKPRILNEKCKHFQLKSFHWISWPLLLISGRRRKFSHRVPLSLSCFGLCVRAHDKVTNNISPNSLAPENENICIWSDVFFNFPFVRRSLFLLGRLHFVSSGRRNHSLLKIENLGNFIHLSPKKFSLFFFFWHFQSHAHEHTHNDDENFLLTNSHWKINRSIWTRWICILLLLTKNENDKWTKTSSSILCNFKVAQTQTLHHHLFHSIRSFSSNSLRILGGKFKLHIFFVEWRIFLTSKRDKNSLYWGFFIGTDSRVRLYGNWWIAFDVRTPIAMNCEMKIHAPEIDSFDNSQKCMSTWLLCASQFEKNLSHRSACHSAVECISNDNKTSETDVCVRDRMHVMFIVGKGENSFVFVAARRSHCRHFRK